ncbi:hypothetical protein XELAEV_18012077mg [Xenopus laevis]|uniref:Uncharacterized protein n=1 Tax=Xenopus laevis TaxID=8355 RepID=A0A974DNT9_XENLA|nr:hypothetical protein XELAEV_18012077mg [Xenopus laevis]
MLQLMDGDPWKQWDTWLLIYQQNRLSLFLVGELTLGYLLLLLADSRRVHVYTLFLTMGYLTLFHIQRFLYPAEDQMDFTVPLMMLTQKISRVAFEFHDGHIQTEKPFSSLQRHLAIRTLPSPLSYVSYTLGFLGLLAGPVCSYNDYQIFIHGSEKAGNPNVAVSRKLSLCCLLLAGHLVLSDRFSISADPDRSVFDTINNAAGFGYNGISEDGTDRWDLLSNLDIVKIETATSFKMFIDNWNIQTAVWLKEVCYDRSPYNPLFSTFMLSAFWHGVHPGYYLTFLTAVPITLAARRVRRTIRPWFQGNALNKTVYAVITWLCTQIAISYTVAPFMLLELGLSLKLYRSLCTYSLCC